MISRTNRAASFVLLVACISGGVHAATSPNPEIKFDGKKCNRLALENRAKLIESVAAHLSGAAQLHRVMIEDLDWKSAENSEKRLIVDAIRQFKISQVLLNEAVSNTALLVRQYEGEKRDQLQLQLQTLRARTSDLAAKNAQIIRTLESQQLPGADSVRELTQSLMDVIGYQMEYADATVSTEGKRTR